jgi:hypothetical protein
LWVLTETFAWESFQVHGFYAHHSLATKPDGPGRPKGGVSMLVAAELGEHSIIMSRRDVMVLRGSSFFVIAMYSSPSHSVEEFSDSLLEAMAAVDLTRPVILVGDFNCRIDLPSPAPRTRAFNILLESAGLWIANNPDLKTYESSAGSSTIDLVATNLSAVNVSGVTRLTNKTMTVLRNHIPMTCHLNLLRNAPKICTPPARLGKRLNYSLLANTATKLWALMSEFCEDPETLALALKDCIVLAAISPPTNVRKAQAWFNEECFRARQLALQALQLCGTWDCMRPLYQKYRRQFKILVKQRKLEFAHIQEAKLVREAEACPYKFGQSQTPKITCPIPSNILREHYIQLAQGADTVPVETPFCSSVLNEEQTRIADIAIAPFTVEEVTMGVTRLKLNKAEGIDRVRNEHIRESPLLWPFIACLFSICLRVGSIPDIWRTCLMTVIPKGKGDPKSPSSWRGISMKCVLGKLLSSLLAERLLRFLQCAGAIPDEQHGFLRDRSTETAFASLRAHVRSRMAIPKGHAFVAFIDFKAAFDTASRKVIMEKLANLGVPNLFLRLLRSILQENLVIINDGIRHHLPFAQTTGLPQGDTFSSLLFVVLLYDLPAFIKEKFPDVDIVLYADDIALIASSARRLEAAMEALVDFCQNCGLQINTDKTKAMKFRRGGRMAAADILTVKGNRISFVSTFTYLGFVLTPTFNAFTKHLQNRRFNAIRNMFMLPDLKNLSLDTGLKLFNIRIAPCVSYGIRQIWPFLRVANLQAIDSVKTTYLKKLLSVSKFTRNRIVYLLVGCKTFIEEILETFQLEKTDAVIEFLAGLERKFENLDLNIFRTSPFQEEEWRQPLVPQRHLHTRVAAHGFHHKFCVLHHWHEAATSCTCRYCGLNCPQYHLLDCLMSPYALLEQFDTEEGSEIGH